MVFEPLLHTAPGAGPTALSGSVLVKQELPGSHPVCSPTMGLGDSNQGQPLSGTECWEPSMPGRKDKGPTALTLRQLPPRTGVDQDCWSARLRRENQKKPLGQLTDSVGQLPGLLASQPRTRSLTVRRGTALWAEAAGHRRGEKATPGLGSAPEPQAFPAAPQWKRGWGGGARSSSDTLRPPLRWSPKGPFRPPRPTTKRSDGSQVSSFRTKSSL